MSSQDDGIVFTQFHNFVRNFDPIVRLQLASADRIYLRHDMITIPARKDQQYCLWLFNDLIVFSCIKRKPGSVNRRTSVLLWVDIILNHDLLFVARTCWEAYIFRSQLYTLFRINEFMAAELHVIIFNANLFDQPSISSATGPRRSHDSIALVGMNAQGNRISVFWW